MKEKKKKERKLSKAELKRKEEFEQLTEKLIAERYGDSIGCDLFYGSWSD